MTVAPGAGPMRWSLQRDEFAPYVAHQLSHFHVPGRPAIAGRDLEPFMATTLDRVQRCFSQIRRKYFFDGQQTLFDHRHGDQWAMFLYYLSNTVHREAGPEEVAAMLFQLNKSLHGADLFYGISLPEVSLLIHPVGTVLGNARYGNYFVSYQNCAVGAVESGVYPTFHGENVLFARSAVLGASTIGRNVIVGANAFLINSDIPGDHAVVGAYPNHRVVPMRGTVIDRLFR